MQTGLQFQSLLQNGYQQVGAESGPDLDTHGVLGVADERADAQVTLDPFEEKFDLPTRAIDLADLCRGQPKVIGQEDQRARLLDVVEADAAQRLRVTLLGVKASQPNRLVAPQTTRGIHGPTFDDVELQVRFAADDEEGTGLREATQAREIQIAAIHHIDRSGLERQIVQEVDLVDRALGQSDKRGDRAAQIQERMQFDRGLRGTKMCPRKKAQTQVDDGGIERVHGLVEFERKRLGCVELAGPFDQSLHPIGIDAPVSAFVGIGQGAARHPAPQSHLVEQRLARAQRRFQIAQTLPCGELREGHRQPLVVARERFDAGVAAVALDAAMEGLVVTERKHLSEYGRSRHGRRKSGTSWRKKSDRTQNVAHSELCVITVSIEC